MKTSRSAAPAAAVVDTGLPVPSARRVPVSRPSLSEGALAALPEPACSSGAGERGVVVGVDPRAYAARCQGATLLASKKTAVPVFPALVQGLALPVRPLA